MSRCCFVLVLLSEMLSGKQQPQLSHIRLRLWPLVIAGCLDIVITELYGCLTTIISELIKDASCS